MSIRTELDRIIGLVHESHEKARAKGGTAATPLLANLPGVIESIPQGVELPALTNPGSASDLLSGKQLIDADGNVVTGNIATKTASNLSASGATVTVPAGYYASQATKSVATATQATPSVSIDSAGKITASATQTAGYVAAGTKTGTKQLTTQAAQTITPGTSDKTIASGRYLTGTQTIKGDANLVADNIKSGVSIFGVAGNYEGSGGGSGGGSVETCTLNIECVGMMGPIIPQIRAIICSVYENGIQQYKFLKNISETSMTINNVIVGSVIEFNATNSSSARSIQNADEIDVFGSSYHFVFAITAPDGGLAKILVE